MKKIYLYGLTAVLALVGLSSCGSDEHTDSRLTYYPVLEMQGDDFIAVPVGTSYTDPGCKATLGGEDYSDKVKVTGLDEVDVNQLGLYDIIYTAVNADGFASTASRTVCVYDPTVTLDIAGTYSTDMAATTYGTAGRTFADYAAAFGNTSQCVGITFSQFAPGIFYCNDLFGGWYNQIRGYGANYDMTGYVCLNPDNTITLLSSYIKGWGDGLDYIEDGVYNPETGQISYSLSYAGQIFMDMVLNKD